MKKIKIILSIIITILLIGTTSCNSSNSSYFELSAFTNNSDNDVFDSKYFYRNDLNWLGADASCIYVPEGRHKDNQGNDEYGGYYYIYPTGIIADAKGPLEESQDAQGNRLSDANGNYFITDYVLRSKDLVNWEHCGYFKNSFCLQIHDDDWANGELCAPDIIYDEKSGKYFIYEQGWGKIYDDNPSLYTECHTQEMLDEWKAYMNTHTPSITRDMSRFDNYYIGIFVSDYPTGPFVPVTSESYYGDPTQPNLNGKVISRFNPPINFQYDLGITTAWGAIDAHPFLDDDGQLYLYFCRHVDSYSQSVDIWGMKMKDMVTPDYSTMTLLIKGGYEYITKNENWKDEPWSYDSYDFGPEYETENGKHYDGNEAPFMMTKNYVNDKGETVKRYFLSYCGGGYNSKYYDICQTICDGNPLGVFKKPTQYASSICGTSYDNSWMAGSGHGCLVHSPDNEEMFILAWGHANDRFDALMYGRWYAVERVHWVENPEYGLLLYGNGPTKSCQPKMYYNLDVTNIASEATVSINTKNKYSGEKYLNDELFVSHKYYGDWEFKCDGEVEIKLTFDKPRAISSVLVYNTYDYDYAFSAVDYMEFDLAEKPSWYTQDNYVSTARISNIEFGKDFIGSLYDYVESGAACLASFDEIKVNSVTIKISKKISNKVSSEIRISDIVILGK